MSVVGKEDILEKERLQGKLNVPGDFSSKPSWTEEALDNLLKVNTRLAGQHSLLHVGWRELEDVGKLESGRMDYNARSFERGLKKGKYVFPTQQQKDAIAVAQGKGSARHLTVRGRAGSGKTIILLGFVAEHMRHPDKKKKLILTAYRQFVTDKIMRYLENEVKCPADDRIVLGWEDLLNDLRVDPRTAQRKHTHGNVVTDTPATISSLSKAAVERFPGCQIVLAIDELDAGYAPLTADGENDWSKIEVPDNVSLALVFNPGSIRIPMHLSTDSSFHHVTCDIRFRSTRSIMEVIDCVAEHSGQGLTADLDRPDRLSNDVTGVKPGIADLGQLNAVSDLANALKRIKMKLDEEGRCNIVLLYNDYDYDYDDDRYLSSDVKKEVLDFARNSNWQAFRSSDFTGSEADTVVFVGPGGLEPLSRARLRLCVVLLWDKMRGKEKYDRYRPGYKRAISENLFEILICPT